MNRPEFHWYDRDDDIPPKYHNEMDSVNARGNGSYGVLTGKREIENYLHADAIHEECGHPTVVTGMLDVPATIAELVHVADPGHVGDWAGLSEEKKGSKIKSEKRRLNDAVAGRMTAQRIAQSDPNGHIEAFLRRVAAGMKKAAVRRLLNCSRDYLVDLAGIDRSPSSSAQITSRLSTTISP